MSQVRKNEVGNLTHLLDNGVLLQSELVFIAQVRELLLGDVDARLGNEVDLPLLQPVVQRIYDSVEAGRSNLARLVHQRDTEQLALALLGRERFYVALLNDARFDRPIVLVRAEAFNRVDRAASAIGSRASLSGRGSGGSGRSGGSASRAGCGWSRSSLGRWSGLRLTKTDGVADFTLGVLDDIERKNDKEPLLKTRVK